MGWWWPAAGLGALSVAVHAWDLLKEVTIILARAAAMVHIATPRPRSGAEAGKTPCLRGGQEELPHVRGQGQWPRVPGCDGAGAAKRSYPTSEVRGGSHEELPRIRGQGGGREELSHARGQGRWPEGATPGPRSGGCPGAGGLEELFNVQSQVGLR